MGLRRGREREDGWSGGEWVARSGGFPTAVGLNGRLGKRPSVCWERGPAVRIPPEGGATNSEPSAGGERPLAGARGYGGGAAMGCRPLAGARGYGEALRWDVVHLLALAATGRRCDGMSSTRWRSRLRGRRTKGIHSLTLAATNQAYGTFFSSGLAGAATGAGSKSSSDFCGRLVKV